MGVSKKLVLLDGMIAKSETGGYCVSDERGLIMQVKLNLDFTESLT